MLHLGSERTLFQIAIDRLQGLFPPERILVVTVAEQSEQLQNQAPQIPADNYLLEPMPRGTASVIGLAAVALSKRDPSAVMAVLTADHTIQDVGLFQELLRSAHAVAEKGLLVTLGIEPTHPSTGYGYIQRGKRLEAIGDQPVYQVERFKEKPDLAAAKQMLAHGDHDWNSGMFVWQTSRIMAEFLKQMPELAKTLAMIEDSWDTPRRSEVIQSLWPGIHPQTIDYGIMERAERVAVLPAAGLGWNDVGSWDALFEVLPGDENGNRIIEAETIGLNTHGSIILSDKTQRLIATIGVNNLIIIDTGDVLLVCSRDDAQKVREVVQQLKNSDKIRYL